VEGKKASAMEELKLLEESALKDAEPEDMRRAGLLAVELGDISGAQKIAAKMETLPSLQGSAYTRNCYYNLKGVVEHASGKSDSAIDSQRRAAIFYPSYQSYLALGDDYTSRKDWQNASKAYQRYLDFHGEILHEDLPSNWVLAHLWTARSLAGAGDSTKSLQYYDEFLRLWANADPDLSLLRVARDEREKLNATIQKGLSSD
jgi:tetratricopeptide (TPR) repeat protein